MKQEVKNRSSIITIILVIFIFIILAFLTIKFIELYNSIPKNTKEQLYFSNLDEEEMMKYEYKNINEELNGIYAFGVCDSSIVAIKGNQDFIKIVDIDSSKQYDYLYYNTKMYLLEKDSGIISIIPLNSEYNVENQIRLNCKVDCFEVYNEDIYYISNDKLFRYNNGNVKEFIDNITSKNFIIKNDIIYLSKGNVLTQIDMQKNETAIQEHVKEIYYYNYYERNKLIYDVQIDDINNFKGVYNFYTKEITNSIRNNTYFIPYNSSNYIYLTNEKDKVMMINRSGSSSILYSFTSKIDNINFLKDGYLLFSEGDSISILNIEDKSIENSQDLKKIDNIKYIK